MDLKIGIAWRLSVGDILGNMLPKIEKMSSSSQNSKLNKVITSVAKLLMEEFEATDYL